MFKEETKAIQIHVDFFEEKIKELFEKAKRKEKSFLMIESIGLLQAFKELKEKKIIKRYEIKIGKCQVGFIFEYLGGIYTIEDDKSTLREIKYLGDR